MRQHKHIGCYGIITQDKKILLIKKSRGPYTGKLDLPGGGIEHDEQPEECLMREILEETGLFAKDVKLVDCVSFRVTWQDGDDLEDLLHVGILYRVETKNPKQNKLDADGLDSLGSNWYDMNNLTKDNLSPFAHLAITKYKK